MLEIAARRSDMELANHGFKYIEAKSELDSDDVYLDALQWAMRVADPESEDDPGTPPPGPQLLLTYVDHPIFTRILSHALPDFGQNFLLNAAKSYGYYKEAAFWFALNTLMQRGYRVSGNDKDFVQDIVEICFKNERPLFILLGVEKAGGVINTAVLRRVEEQTGLDCPMYLKSRYWKE
ncbi:hypothetical protein HDV00_001342 [Rhizophlyctis rosea]|nr:hypothetical protein HDV00_001342 [Rhizophlyctis rosea]